MNLFFDSKNKLGECILWCERKQALFWVDIVGRTLSQLTLPEKVLTQWDMPESLACIALTNDDDLLLIGLASRLAFFSLVDQSITTICAVEPELALTRINDGRCDRQGRFVFGTLNQHSDRAKLGGFYRLGHDLVLERLPIASVAIANSVCFSADGKTMYYCDSLTKAIYQCDYDSNSPSAFVPRLFVNLADQAGVPDGSIIDAEGYLWNAQWGGGVLVRYSPDGVEVQRVELPITQPTCATFGGGRLDTLFVTSATDELGSIQLAQQVQAGGVFAHQSAGIRGLPEQRFIIGKKLHSPSQADTRFNIKMK